MDIKFYKKKIYELAMIEPIKGSKMTDCKWNVTKIKNPFINTKWFADPFILDYDDKSIILLVEEMDFKINRGRIAKLIIDRDKNEITDIKVLLDLDTHLSFPAIERIGEDIYVYPENSASGQLNIYKYNKETESLDSRKILISEPLTDSILRNYNNEQYIFSTKQPNPNGNILKIYKKTGGRFEEFQEVIFSDNSARGAGNWFYVKDKLIRPAQDCNGYYGIGLIFQEVGFSNNRFEFNEISRVKHPSGYDGMHTFNEYKELCIIDYRRPVYPFIYYPLAKISKFLRKFL